MVLDERLHGVSGGLGHRGAGVVVGERKRAVEGQVRT